MGLYINEKNVGLINQTVESLTEYCQGPCHENQVIMYTQNILKSPCVLETIAAIALVFCICVRVNFLALVQDKDVNITCMFEAKL